MEHPTITPQTVIADLLASSPDTVRILIDLRVDCIGCSMSKFCTLQEMCDHYGLQIDMVLDLINIPLP